jgi:hypothetical protein
VTGDYYRVAWIVLLAGEYSNVDGMCQGDAIQMHARTNIQRIAAFYNLRLKNNSKKIVNSVKLSERPHYHGTGNRFLVISLNNPLEFSLPMK